MSLENFIQGKIRFRIMENKIQTIREDIVKKYASILADKYANKDMVTLTDQELNQQLANDIVALSKEFTTDKEQHKLIRGCFIDAVGILITMKKNKLRL